MAKSSFSKIAAGLVAVACLTAAYLYFFSQGDLPKSAVAVENAAVSAAQNMPARTGSVPKVNLEVATSAGPADNNPIQRDYLQARNYAAFIDAALKKPSDGGRFYAGIAFYRCMSMLSLPIEWANSAAGDKQNEARRRAGEYVRDMHSRCQPVAEQYPDQLAFDRLLNDERLGKDSKLAAFRRFQGVAGVPLQTQLSDLNRAVSSRDSLDIATAIELTAPSIANSLVPEVNPKAHFELIISASSAAACEISATCHTHPMQLGRCMQHATCEPGGWSEVQRARWTGAKQELFDALKRELVEVGLGRRAI
jgi:hypothetical protein